MDEFSLSNSRTGTWFFWAARRTGSPLDDCAARGAVRRRRRVDDLAVRRIVGQESRARFAAGFRAGFLAAGFRAFFTEDGSDDLRRASISAWGSEDSL